MQNQARHFSEIGPVIIYVEKILAKEPFPAPKFIMNPEIKNFYDFTVDDFALEGYEFHKLEDKIPVAI